MPSAGSSIRALLSLLLLLGLVSCAGASTASMGIGLSYGAAAGESNRLTVTYEPGLTFDTGTYVLDDPGATIIP